MGRRDVSAAVTRALLALGDRPWAAAALVVFTILEATVFPAPTEAMLLAMCLSRPRRAPWFALVAVAGSLAGAILGYHMGARAFSYLSGASLAAPGYESMLPRLEAAYRENMFRALVTSGYTPIPYFVYTSAAGAFSLPLGPFLIGSLLGRSLKYLPIALIAWWLGPAARAFLARHAGRAGIVITLLLIGFLLLRLL